MLMHFQEQCVNTVQKFINSMHAECKHTVG